LQPHLPRTASILLLQQVGFLCNNFKVYFYGQIWPDSGNNEQARGSLMAVDARFQIFSNAANELQVLLEQCYMPKAIEER
jgi:hypothetical protein